MEQKKALKKRVRWTVPEPLLEIKGLVKHFPVYSGIIRHEVARVHAVNGVDLTLNEGETLGLVGESGSGKSTIGRLSLGLTEPTAGEIRFEGKEINTLQGDALKEFRKSTQMVFQDPFSSLNPRKTILESIGEGLQFHGITKTTAEMTEKVLAIAALVGLPKGSLYRYPHEFSGGQQQRICIGRAIALNPKLIICDEAVSALDISYQAQILKLFKELRDRLKLSYLFISHDLGIVRYLADRVAVLYLGKVMETGSSEALFSNPKHPYTRSLLSSIPKSHPGETKEKIKLTGEIPSSLNPPSGCPFRTRCPYAQKICAEPPPLKTVKDPKTGKDDHHYFCILD